MKFLNDHNKVQDTDTLDQETYYWVLRRPKDQSTPDFYCEHMTQVEQFSSYCTVLHIGPFEVVMPIHWSVLCSDMESVHTIPLHEISARDYHVFGMNPLDGYMPDYLRLRQRDIYANTSWTCPPMEDKDMLVVPLGNIERPNRGDTSIERGPVCAIFSPNRIDVTWPISDIW